MQLREIVTTLAKFMVVSEDELTHPRVTGGCRTN